MYLAYQYIRCEQLYYTGGGVQVEQRVNNHYARQDNNYHQTKEVKRGDIFYADLDPTIGSEQGGERPVLVIQNNIGNQHSPTIIVAAITSHLEKTSLPTHVNLPGKDNGLSRDSVILLEQIRTIDKSRLTFKISEVDCQIMNAVEKALKISLGLPNTCQLPYTKV